MKRELLPYAEARKDFLPGDCVTWEGSSLLSRLIGIFTKSKTTHISLLLMEVREVERWLIMEAWEGGSGYLSGNVGNNFLSQKIEEYKGKAVWRPLISMLDPFRSEIVKSLWTYKDIKYDYKSLLRQAIRRVGVCKKALFCSELAQVVYRESIPTEILNGMPHNKEMKMLLENRKAMQPRDFDCLPLFSREIELI
jgi:hypothetical protein